MSRWVRIQADVFDHAVFAPEPYSEREAWLWLISKAAWKETRHRVGNAMTTVPVGSLFVTLRELQETWGWGSDYRVRTFLKLLQSEGMIAVDANAGKTRVTICNYSRYQNPDRDENAEKTQTERTENALKTPEHQNTNTSSLRSEGRRTPRDELEIVLDAERAQAVIDHRQRIRKPLTAHAAKLLAGKFAKVADPNAAADAMVANGWQGFEPQWLENRGAIHQPSTAPPPKPRTVAELAIHRLRTGDFRNDDSSNSDRFLGTGDGSGQDQSARILELAAIAAHGRR